MDKSVILLYIAALAASFRLVSSSALCPHESDFFRYSLQSQCPISISPHPPLKLGVDADCFLGTNCPPVRVIGKGGLPGGKVKLSGVLVERFGVSVEHSDSWDRFLIRGGQKYMYVLFNIEWLTAGDCIAGMHEVIVTNRTIDAIKLATEQNRLLWRVSSTLFAHIASEAVLKPLGHFAESPLASKYPPIHAGEFVEQELAVINLKGNKD
ncbi:hypothetical protein D8674_011375 [Pyrus ussuriensis x Pyrus communis]|uniref:Uncharacterized protein n=1 Tax=Pyrus ussuriensis x Pyrus communis TaxID=2448454 RepID=A0A5N5FZA6_9ROSA|nr:hypothetical protein D8674_011375 [Pyrus ussuriensis x Pyrus communis]